MVIVSVSVGFPNGAQTFIRQFMIDDKSLYNFNIDSLVQDWTDALKEDLMTHIEQEEE